jgi:hypothetical protein
LAVSPAPLLTGSFSPRPTLNDTPFFVAILVPHPASCNRCLLIHARGRSRCTFYA